MSLVDLTDDREDDLDVVQANAVQADVDEEESAVLNQQLEDATKASIQTELERIDEDLNEVNVQIESLLDRKRELLERKKHLQDTLTLKKYDWTGMNP